MRLRIHDITRIAIFAALTCVLSQIIIPLPFTPVPLTMGLLAVFITGALLPPKGAVLAQTVYLALGIIGLPVFHGFTGGFTRVLGPTGGYLMVYPLMALCISLSVALSDRKSGTTSFSMKLAFYCLGGHLMALLVCYGVGTLWMCVYSSISFMEALPLAVLPFIPLDIVKGIFCVFCVLSVRGRIYGAFRRGI